MNRDFFYNWHKTTLKKHTSEVDVDAIWAAIEPEVDVINAERKRRKGFFFFLFGLCILILSVGFIGLFAPNLALNNTRITKTLNTLPTPTDKEGTHIDTYSIADSPSADTANSKLATKSKIKSDKTTTNILLPSKISSSSKKINDAIIQEKNRRYSTPNTTSEIRISPSAFIAQTNNVQSNSENSSSNLAIELGQSSMPQVEEAIEQERLLAVSTVKNSPILPVEILDEPSVPSVEIRKSKQKSFHLSLSIYSGIGFVNRTLSVKEKLEGDQILLLRDATEQSLELLNNGVKIGLQHKGGLNGSIGFQYARVTERFQYDTRFLERDSSANQVIGHSNNLLGGRNTIIGYAPNNTLHDLEYDFFNNYHFLEIPISIGYQKRLSSWNVGFRASYIQNISLRTKGRVLDSEFEVINITDENDLFKTRLNASLEAGIHAEYNFTRHVAVGLDAFYRHVPGSITKTEYSLDQNYNWLGMNASLKYSF